MKRRRSSLICVFVWALLIPSSAYPERGIKLPGESGRRSALVIGNGDYKSAPLRNPLNDAADMARLLRTLGFDVIHEKNADQRMMEEAIRYFGRKLRKGGIGLFYYAGHGMQVSGSNYLTPIGADIFREIDVRYESVDVSRILDEMREAHNDLNIIILDACRNNPFSSAFRSRNVGLARMDAPTGSLIAYATAPGSVAADGPGRNGIYTRHLIKSLRKPGLPVERVFKNVRIAVMEETANKQIPWESSSLTREFYFVPKDETEAARQSGRVEKGSPSQPSHAAKDKEILFWESIKDSHDPAYFDEYLKIYPNGTFAGLARLKKQQLAPERQEAPEAGPLKQGEAKKTAEKHMAYAPKEATPQGTGKILLRNTPGELKEEDLDLPIRKHHFFVSGKNEQGDFPNDFVDNQDGTVTDRTTALMWQKGGSFWFRMYENAHEYIDRLNEIKFAGHSDWRLPTMEELCSLLEPEKNEKGLFVSSHFNDRQKKCWSSDYYYWSKKTNIVLLDYSAKYRSNHIVDFSNGTIGGGIVEVGYTGISLSKDHCYVRAVRGLEP